MLDSPSDPRTLLCDATPVRVEKTATGVLLTAAAHPFRVERKVALLPQGATLAEMLADAQPDPVLRAHAVIFIAGHVIERRYWHAVRPKAGVHVEIRVLPRKGANVLRTVLTIAVIAVSIAAPYLAPGLVGSVAGGLGISTAQAASLVTSVIGAVGLLAINALVPVKQPGLGSTERSRVFSIEGTRNQARAFQPVPQVLGKHRVKPDYGARPYTEIVGSDQYLRVLFVWGVGPMSIDTSSLKIGETLLSEFDGLETEHREGYATDTPLTLYPGTVIQEDLTVKLETDTDVVRTTAADADEIGFDLTFPEGLYERSSNTGDLSSKDVELTVEYREVGSGTWLTPTYTATTVPAGQISGSTLDIRAKRASPIRHGFRWTVTPGKQYEIKLRRTNEDQDAGNGNFDDVFLSAIRTFRNEDPIQSRVPVAKTALRIKATDQLNGVVDEFSGIVTTKGKDWNGSSWVDDQPLQNPAALFRHVLQGKANAAPLADSRIDLTGLEDWHDFCGARGLKCNQVRDTDGSVWDALVDVSAAGRAAPVQVDGKWSVAIERSQPVPVSHITPRNSYDFQSEKAFLDLPHAFRIPFPNENEDYRLDERRVYRTGFDASSATRFEQLELPGVTDPDQTFRLGRLRMAQAIHQPERWSFRQDMEFLTYAKGDRVAITHDVLLVGLKSGRVKAVTADGSKNVTALELDETVTMEVDKDYGIAIRTVNDAHVTEQVILDPGDQTTVTLSTPIAAVGGQPAVAKGDLFGFGLLGAETDDALVIAIVPETELQARIVAVPYREAVYDTESETIPPFATTLTPVATLPMPTVTDVVSDESVLAFGAGDALRTRIAVSFNPVSDSDQFVNLRAEIRGRPSETGEPFASMRVDEQSGQRIIVSDVHARETWDLRLRFNADGRLPGGWSYVYNHTVVGKSTPPAGLSGLTVSVFGGQAFLRWDEPPEIDVRFGGEVRFRHSPAMSGATWASSNSIGEAARARSRLASLPLKPGTYLARVFDVAGTPSDTIASVTTKQASVLTYASADTLDEAPDFGGTHSGTMPDAGILKLEAESLVDDMADVDSVADWDSFGGVALSGTYDFEFGFDFGSVVKVRLTARVSMTSVNVLDLIDDHTDPMDDWESFDGDVQGAGDVRVEVRHTDDDPGGSPTWSAWERLDAAEFEARGFDFRAILLTSDPAVNVHVTDLGIDAEQIT